MRTIFAAGLIALVFATAIQAAEFHVATTGDDGNPGTSAQPFRTIQHAAGIAQPGDVITVHAGTYRERVNPPRGGESDTRRIVYQAAPGEKVVITGAEVIKGWQKVAGDTWKVVIPSTYFGGFNPYSDLIRGDWFNPEGRQHHTGAVYLNGDWLTEAPAMDAVLAPSGATPLWYATVDGAAGSGNFLVNLAWLKPGQGAAVPAAHPSAKHGGQAAPCTEGGQCVGFIYPGDWLRYDNVDFGAGTNEVELHVAAKTDPSHIELRLDNAGGPLLGTADVAPTGDWQKWVSVHAAIPRTSGKHTVCVVFKSPPAKTDNTTIWAQFKGVDPNAANVEINVRKTVFTPEATGINYITVRGFTLRDAATNWAPPTAGQIGLVTAYWCKGWIIEDNDIAYSTCCGVSLGKYSDEFDNTAATASGYVGTLTRALKNGWNKETVGSHIVRNNVISHCEQTGVVGSLGCSYSTVSGNVIHDIHIRQLFGGAEMGGIKFHGGIDVTISHNHIYRCGDLAGVWLDWMGQGAHITGNLMHDNIGNMGDIFLEMQHGPILIANNILLSHADVLNAQGVTFAHNLIMGSITNMRGDGRSTPYQAAHSTEVAGMYPAPKGDSGDDRAYNNIIVAPCSLKALDNSALPCFADGNVFTRGAAPSKFDTDAAPVSDPVVKLSEEAGSWYLEITPGNAWSIQRSRKLVTTELLGSARVSGEAFENADGTPIRIDTDYFGKKRNEQNPAPGPFENPGTGSLKLKVW